MTAGKRLLARILWVLAGASAFLLFVSVAQSHGTPIAPDVQKMLSHPMETPGQYPLARAGWDGPEVTTSAHAMRNATYDRLGPAGTARETHDALTSAAVPDLRAIGGIALVILLLRRIRRERPAHYAGAATHGKVMTIPAAAHDTHDHQSAA